MCFNGLAHCTKYKHTRKQYFNNSLLSRIIFHSVKGYTLNAHCHILTREVPNIRILASVPNSGPNSVFVFRRIVSSERIRVVCIVQLVTSTIQRPTSLSQCQMLSLRLPDYGRRMKGRGSWLDNMHAQP